MAGSFVKEFWRKSKGIDVKIFLCEGESFELMALCSDKFKQVQSCETSQEMLNLASNLGQMFERERIADNVNMSQDFERFWIDLDDSLEYDDTPTLREQVGKYVCDISGLSNVLSAKIEEEDLAELEKEENLVLDADTCSQEQLANDAEAHQLAHNNAA